MTLFPGRGPPSYSYIGSTSGKVGGAGRLAELVWRASARPPTGDVLAYCLGMAGKGRTGKGGKPKREMQADHQTIMEALGKHGRRWTPVFDDDYLMDMVAELDWYQLGEMSSGEARSVVKDAWFRVHEKRKDRT